MGQGRFHPQEPQAGWSGGEGVWGRHPRVFPPLLQGRWLRWPHLLLTHHPELLSWQHILIQEEMGTSAYLTKEEAAP